MFGEARRRDCASRTNALALSVPPAGTSALKREALTERDQRPSLPLRGFYNRYLYTSTLYHSNMVVVDLASDWMCEYSHSELSCKVLTYIAIPCGVTPIDQHRNEQQTD